MLGLETEKNEATKTTTISLHLSELVSSVHLLYLFPPLPVSYAIKDDITLQEENQTLLACILYEGKYFPEKILIFPCLVGQNFWRTFSLGK